MLRVAEFQWGFCFVQSCLKGRWVGNQLSNRELIKMVEEGVEAAGKGMSKPTYGCDYASPSEGLETFHKGAETLDRSNHCTDIDVIGISRQHETAAAPPKAVYKALGYEALRHLH